MCWRRWGMARMPAVQSVFRYRGMLGRRRLRGFWTHGGGCATGLLRANAEGAPHMIGADFPSSGAHLVTTLATELGFPFLGVKNEKIAARVQAARDEGAGLFVFLSFMALVVT